MTAAPETVPVDDAAAHWAASWPDTITLGEAACTIDFDLFAGDDEHQVLTKVRLPRTDVTGMTVQDAEWELEECDANDAEDRTGRLRDGLLSGGAAVPPVVLTTVHVDGVAHGALTDGHHRVALAAAHQLPHIVAYVGPDHPAHPSNHP